MLRARLLPLLAIAFSAAGCGLPAPFYLAPPGVPGTFGDISTSFVYVESTTANDEPEFMGFELYYKLYKDTDIESGFDSSSLLTDLAGFFPMCRQTDPSPSGRFPPLIPILPADRGHAFSVELNFTSPGAAAYVFTGPISLIDFSVGVRRYVSDGGGGCKTFDTTSFDPADADVSAIWPDLTDGIYMAVYALSYGKQDFSTTIWSSPQYLGFVKINFP